MSSEGSQAEFDFSAFETEVTREAEDAVIEAIAESIRRLREQIDDDILDSTFSRGRGEYVLKSKYSKDHLDPEPLTKNRVIEPLLSVLGYEDYGYEAGSLAAERGEQADYAVSLRDIESVDSSRLLIEAEPLKKHLENRGHGLDQVKSWLSQREFESDFGFATDGLRWVFIRYDPDSYTHNVIEDVDLRPVFLTLFDNATGAQAPPTEVISDDERAFIATLLRTFNYDNFSSIIDDAREVIKEKQDEITDEFYDDYIRVVFGVQEDSDDRRARRARSLIGDGIVPPDEADGDEVRLFAVDLMNRLIFVKFLEDRHIVQPDLLNVLSDTYESGIYPQSLYKTFLDPLFYDVFNEKPDKRDPQVADLDVYEEIPYLNGGLFRPELSGDSDLDEREFDVRDSVLESIIDLLERYQFSTDGGPTDIDPSVLGNVFEKTINYLTADPGDQNAELGAYYTPKEITRFSAEETVRPALKDRFAEYLTDAPEWEEQEPKQYDTLYELIDDLPELKSTIDGLLNEMNEFYIVDPGMGSGHFLTSVIEEVVNVRQALWSKRGDRPSRHRLKKTTIQNNIYGVDIMEPAVEIGKLRLWLSIISELREEDLKEMNVEQIALPNITFNVRQGNSLIGYVGFPEETEDGLTTFERWSEDSVRSRYEDVIEQIELHEEYSAFPEEAERYRRKANELLREYRTELDEDILTDFREVADGVTEDDLDEYTPFHWVLEFAEVYADGGFDVIVGNPPWDRLRPTRDDFFMRYDQEFHSLPPAAKDERQAELLEDRAIADAWDDYNHEIEIAMEYFHESDAYTLQDPTVGGQSQSTENDLSSLFFERVFDLAKDGGYVSLVLPGTIFNGASTKDLRVHLLDETAIQSLITWENRDIFEAVDGRYNFGVVAFKNTGTTDELRGIFQQHGLDIIKQFEEQALNIPRKVLLEYSPEARIFPQLRAQEEVGIIEKIVTHPPIRREQDEDWFAQPYRELDRTNDRDRFVEDESDGDYPVFGGSNIYQFSHDPTFVDIDPPEFWSVNENDDPSRSAKYRIREKSVRNLKRAIYDAFDGTGSQVGFVNELLEDYRGSELSEEDVLPDCTEYRIVFRDITKFTNERTIIAAVIPPNVVCTNTLHTIRPYKIDPEEKHLQETRLHSAYDRVFTDESLFAALGLIDSIPFDYLMRTKIDTHIVMYKFEESQVPRLTEDDEWFEYIWMRAARLNCYGDAFDEMRDRLGGIEPVIDPDERELAQAELDAAAFHAYGLERQQTKFVLDDFHQVQDPRRMTDEYFELVLEKYDQLMN